MLNNLVKLVNLKNRVIKIFDSFIFFNEFDLLKSRLEYLGPIVDQFLIVEANSDFSGKSKPFLLKDSLDQLPYAEKIIYLPLDVNFIHPYWLLKRLRYLRRRAKFLWKIQDFQRNAIQKLLIQQDPKPHDIVLFGDLDEFPSKSLLKKIIDYSENLAPSYTNTLEPFTLFKPHTLRQRLFNYHICIIEKDPAWYGTIIAKFEDFRKQLPHQWRSQREQLPFLENGGFHFSYFMPKDKIREKIQAIAEVEKLNDYLDVSLDSIETAIFNHQDIFGRDLGLIKVSYNKAFDENPDAFLDNPVNALPTELIDILHRYMPHVVD